MACLITAADDERGQSIIEFVLMLPVLLIFTYALVKVNTLIQMSIVNQQYVRAKTLSLAYNSSVYPYLNLRRQELDEKNYNQMLVGMSDQAISVEEGREQPDAPVYNIARKGHEGSNEPKAEPRQRTAIRVRTTVSLCTQQNVARNGSSLSPLLPLDQKNNPIGPWALGENTVFEFCRSPKMP
ncbi:MAG: TadE family protein [Bdellovibrionota bacterium]